MEYLAALFDAVEVVPPLCCQWNHTMCRLIEEKQWDQLTPRPTMVDDQEDGCEHCYYRKSPLHDVMVTYLHENETLSYNVEFPPHVVDAVLRMYGHLTRAEWMKYFVRHRPCIPLLRLLFREGRLSPDESDPYTLFSHHVIWWSQDHLDFLLSPEVGATINLQTTLGNTPLLQYVRCTYDDEEEGEMDIHAVESEEGRRSLQRLECLLQYGADPLLANKNGVSPWSYVEGLRLYTEEQKERVLEVMRPYL